jgi:hypothetical protein
MQWYKIVRHHGSATERRANGTHSELMDKRKSHSIKANAFCSTVEKAAALSTRCRVYLLLRYLISINIG